MSSTQPPPRRFDARLLSPGIALGAAAALVLAEVPSSSRLLNAATVAAGVLLIWSTAMATRRRYPDRPLWRLLTALAATYALQVLTDSPDALLFTVARASRPAVEVLLLWVMLAFPTGRLATARDRWLVAASAATVLGLWLPGMMLSVQVPLPGPFVTCSSDCPQNLLFVRDWPQGSALLLGAFRVLGGLVLLAACLHLALRLRHATPLMRRSLAPVLLASIARALNIAAFLLTGGAVLALTFTFWAVPLAIDLGLLRGRLYAAESLQKLVAGLRRRPDMAELRRVMSEALEDDSLQIGYWHEARATWLDADHQVLALPAAGDTHRASRLLHDADQAPIAALVFDRGLLEEPLLLDAVASSMHSALHGHQVEAALSDQRLRSAQAAEGERRRIERDLHDGAQQRLLALRMKVGVTGRLLETDLRRAASLLGEVDADIVAALAELRALAHGIVPPLLAERGLPAALDEAARQAAVPVATELQNIGRIDPAAERAVYFCCIEALQNAAKHAGAGARVRLSLRCVGEQLVFAVEDTGVGSTSTPIREGQGLRNMRERLQALQGELQAGPAEQGGFRVEGRLRCQ